MENSIDSIKNQKWKSLVEEWMTSGQSIASWCQNKNIPDSTFAYWKKKFSTKSPSCQNLFVELPEEESSALQLEYCGAKILLRKNFDEDVLSCCLKILKGVLC